MNPNAPEAIRQLLDGTLSVRDYIDARLIEAIRAQVTAEDAEIEQEILKGPIR